MKPSRVHRQNRLVPGSRWFRMMGRNASFSSGVLVVSLPSSVTIELGFELGSSDPRPHVPRAFWPSVSLGFRSSQPYTEGTESLSSP